jgi:outer membrane protein OmpA-like peptidoglycan-associated protein/TolA-binding protein
MNQRFVSMIKKKTIIVQGLFLFLILNIVVFVFTGCVYYNTFYNAQYYYKQGVKLAKSNPAAAKTNFEKSLAKSAVVVKEHFRSKYADDALFLVGMSYYYMEEYDKAIKNFEDLRIVFPNSPYQEEANYYRGLAYLENDDYGTASVIFADLKENSSRFGSAAAFQTARSFYQKEEYGIAKDSISAFIEKFPKAKERKEATLLLAISYFQLENWRLAAKWFQEYIQKGGVEPKQQASAELKFAECLLNLAVYDSAQIVLSKDFSQYSDLINQVNLLLGKVYLCQEKDEEAIQYLTRVKTGEPGAEAYYLLGQKYEETEDFEQASAYYDTASRAGSNSKFSKTAKKHLTLLSLIKEKSIDTLNPAKTQFRLGEVYGLTMNENERAIQEYQKTYDSFPDSPYAPKALYAQAWIIKNRLNQPDYDTILKTLINRYPRTLYANAARRELGIPEIKLLPKDTASKIPAKESLPITIKPEPESIEVAKEEIPVIPQESMTGEIQPEPVPSPIKSPDLRELAKEEPLPTEKEPLPRIIQPEPESLEVVEPKIPEEPKEILPEEPPIEPESIPAIGPGLKELAEKDTISEKPEPRGRRSRRRRERTKEEILPTIIPEPKESLPVETESLFPQEIAIKETTVVAKETTITPEPEIKDITLSPIHFDFDRAYIREEDKNILTRAVTDIKKDTTFKILVEGYCDPIGTNQYNYNLGLRRANSVKDYLTKLGINRNQITTKSFGETNLVTTDSLGYWKNRRVEFTIEK